MGGATRASQPACGRPASHGVRGSLSAGASLRPVGNSSQRAASSEQRSRLAADHEHCVGRLLARTLLRRVAQLLEGAAPTAVRARTAAAAGEHGDRDRSLPPQTSSVSKQTAGCCASRKRVARERGRGSEQVDAEALAAGIRGSQRGAVSRPARQPEQADAAASTRRGGDPS